MVDFVADPADTRRMLCLALDALASKRDTQPVRRATLGRRGEALRVGSEYREHLERGIEARGDALAHCDGLREQREGWRESETMAPHDGEVIVEQ